MDGLTFRDGTDADLAALCEIEADSFAADRVSRASLRRLLGRETARIRVARAAGVPVGYHLVLVRAGSDRARLYSVAVDRRHRGRGVGGALLADAEKVARRLGRTALRLEVRSDNLAAIRLYERRGYGRIGTWRGYYADKTDALRFEKHLAVARSRQADADEDRSPADFGVSTPFMRLSSLSEISGMSGRREA